MNKLIVGEKKIDLTSRASLMKLDIQELYWIASINRKGYSFKECLIDYILKIHTNDTGRVER